MTVAASSGGWSPVAPGTKSGKRITMPAIPGVVSAGHGGTNPGGAMAVEVPQERMLVASWGYLIPESAAGHGTLWCEAVHDDPDYRRWPDGSLSCAVADAAAVATVAATAVVDARWNPDVARRTTLALVAEVDRRVASLTGLKAGGTLHQPIDWHPLKPGYVTERCGVLAGRGRKGHRRTTLGSKRITAQVFPLIWRKPLDREAIARAEFLSEVVAGYIEHWQGMAQRRLDRPG
jgi:hypothetical protein